MEGSAVKFATSPGLPDSSFSFINIRSLSVDHGPLANNLISVGETSDLAHGFNNLKDTIAFASAKVIGLVKCSRPAPKNGRV
jgi:hypothetical protein